MFYIPAGFAYGFLVLSDLATFTYKCTYVYNPSGGAVFLGPGMILLLLLIGRSRTSIIRLARRMASIPFF